MHHIIVVHLFVVIIVNFLEEKMIELTKFNDSKITVNAEIIESIEETPDTVITLTTGKKLIVKESRQDVVERVISYKKAIYSNIM